MENRYEKTIAITSTFTAEPVEESLDFWRRELEISFKVEFAPYNQIFQQLLDPSSLICQNRNGMNVILFRFEDWIRWEESSGKSFLTTEKKKKIEENVQDLLAALRAASERSATPYLVCVCPTSPASVGDGDIDQMALYKQMEDLMLFELERTNNVHLIKASELTNTYPVSTYYDRDSDELARVPYTAAFFAALGTMIARKFHMIQSAPYKVIVLDCDQTLWKGICGEDGPLGIEIDLPRKKLQEFMIRQLDAGMLICLCSKNNEADVIEVFDHHPEMPLKRDHIMSWRINWGPKSENIKSLANELQLGSDSFIFIDDNPIDCAEVQANCPEVLTLLLPKEAENIPRFLEHVWVFDHLKITEEDKKRTTLYKENKNRDHLLHQSLTLGDFLSSLELKIQIFEAKPNHLTRIGQLTQRTNQFNFTTIRRSEAEIQKLYQSGNLEYLVIEVSDRFGDYGLVGAILFETDSEAIKVDTFLVSCRALGRGVEHRMLARLGEIANERGLHHVEVTCIPTKKNQPARDFLYGIGSKYKESHDGKLLFRLPTEYAKGVVYAPDAEKSQPSVELESEKSFYSQTSGKEMVYGRAKSERLGHIATNLYGAEQILKSIKSQHHKQRPELSNEYIAPGNELERSITKIWQNVLGIEKVGIQDNFFEIGGTSLKGIQIIAQLRRELNISIPVVKLFESPTISSMTRMLGDKENQRAWIDNLYEIRERGEKRRGRRILRKST